MKTLSLFVIAMVVAGLFTLAGCCSKQKKDGTAHAAGDACCSK